MRAENTGCRASMGGGERARLPTGMKGITFKYCGEGLLIPPPADVELSV